ncbi:MAG: hypothetical protein ACYDER_03305 [Ktedonobacteraceae bacterium]
MLYRLRQVDPDDKMCQRVSLDVFALRGRNVWLSEAGTHKTVFSSAHEKSQYCLLTVKARENWLPG